LSTAAPAALGVLGNHILNSNMNASGLRSFLNSQKKKILNALPTGIFLNGIMGIDELSEIAGKFSGSEVPERKEKSGVKWIIPIILILIAGIAVWYFMNKQTPPGDLQQAVTDTILPSKDTIKPSTVVEVKYSVKLPDGVILDAKKGGDSVSNKLLSESRANAVAEAIKAAGANSNQIAGVEGFGSDFAKYPADAADSIREKDKRISISVRSK